MYDLLKQLKSNPYVYGKYLSILNTGQEAQQARISNRLFNSIEQNLSSDKPSSAIIQFLLKHAAKTNEQGQQTSAQQSYLDVFGEDAKAR